MIDDLRFDTISTNRLLSLNQFTVSPLTFIIGSYIVSWSFNSHISMPKKTPSPRIQTRDKLVEVARHLFHQHGYRATGIAEILRKAEINSGSLYYFFPAKEDLLVAVLERYRELLRPMIIDPAFERVSDPLDRIFAVRRAGGLSAP